MSGQGPRPEDFYRLVRHAETMKVKGVEREKAVRLYCTQSYGGGAWALQVRSPLTRADRSEGKDFIVAHASLDRSTLLALRDAIDAQLRYVQPVYYTGSK